MWLVVGLALGAVAAQAQESTPTATTNEAPRLDPGDRTAARAYLAAAEDAEIEITPILTAGEFVGEYQMAGNPSGLGGYTSDGDVILAVTHGSRPQDVGHRASSRVSLLTVDPDTAGVLAGSYPIDGTQELWSLAGATVLDGDGFDEPRVLTGEAATTGPNGGVSVLIDAQGEVIELPWTGAFSHQGWIRLPGYGDRVVLIGTDSDPRGSELYLYVANSATGLRAGQGRLSVFVADNLGGTASVTKTTPITGRFLPIPLELAETAADLQNAATAAGAFTFVRLGGIAVDPSREATIYVTDAGDGRGAGASTNGRVYRIELDPGDATGNAEMSVLLDGDDGDDIRNPDGIAVSETTLMIQESLAGANLGPDTADPSRLIAYDLEEEELSMVAFVDQSDDPDLLVDEGGRAGAWGQAGITEASALFGEGAWLLTVQARTLRVPQFDGRDEGGQLLLIRYPATAPATPSPVSTTTATATSTTTADDPTPTPDQIIDPPTEVPPTEIPPTPVPTEIPPTPTDVPPTPTDVPPTPTEIPPTEIPPTPTEVIPPTEIPPTPTEPVFEPTPTEPAG